jgi:hypothetical protein
MITDLFDPLPGCQNLSGDGDFPLSPGLLLNVSREAIPLLW